MVYLIKKNQLFFYRFIIVFILSQVLLTKNLFGIKPVNKLLLLIPFNIKRKYKNVSNAY